MRLPSSKRVAFNTLNCTISLNIVLRSLGRKSQKDDLHIDFLT